MGKVIDKPPVIRRTGRTIPFHPDAFQVIPGQSSTGFSMAADLILASGSDIRQDLLRSAGLSFEVQPARVDEDMIKASLLAEGANSRDVADTLAEFKARRIAEKNPGALILGCD